MEAPKLIEVLGSEAIVLAACGRNHTLALTGGGKPQQNALKLLGFALVSWLFPIFGWQRVAPCMLLGRTKWGSLVLGTKQMLFQAPHR